MSESCDLMDCSPRGSSVHRTLQARILEWVAILFSRKWHYSFFLKAEQYSSVCMYVDVYTPPLPHPSSVHGHLACFRVSAIVNSAAMDMGGHASF